MENKKRMPSRILMTADTMGGVWTYTLELIKALEPFGMQVALATMGHNLSFRQREQVAALPQVTLYESNYKLEWMDNPWEDLKAAGDWLLQINQEFQPDIIHLNNFCHGNLNWGKPVVMVVHSCVSSWWQAVKGKTAPADWAKYQKVVAEGLQAADLVIAPTAAMLQEARELYGPFQQSQVIYNGQDTAKFKYAHKEPFVFSMGRVWDEAKNISLLAQAGANLDWPVYIAGDARHPVTGHILELPNVHFLGVLSESEIIDWLSRAAIFCLPVKYEPFGLAILEAALSGCALVVGDIPTQREIWGTAATYVNTDNAGDLTTAISKLIQDEFIRNIMSFRAMQQGLGYSTKQTAYDYRRAYHLLQTATIHQQSSEEIFS
ncbi:glycosyl transferase [Adhaeribacter aerolatus]|uniref:Glycosyl transferase n=1 Tax=Adhaeribacter aerolatus TaxID=670289 RepID=A0A512B3I8_9BACT|nr:glycosyltransferase family 4 protein [Adhaeribacter aerolatus]GEO06357.1 glycosyl transferase [Adhaeribacter aerolatus]